MSKEPEKAAEKSAADEGDGGATVLIAPVDYKVQFSNCQKSNPH